MKFTKLLTLGAAVLSTPVTLSPQESPVIMIERIETAGILGPFDEETPSTFAFNVYVEPGDYFFQVAIKDLTRNVDVDVGGQKFTSTSVSKANSVSYTTDLSGWMGANGIRVTVTILQSSRIILGRTFTLKPKVTDTITSTDYMYRPYVIKDTTICIDRLLQETCREEIYDFSNTIMDVETTTEFNLPLDDIIFTHTEGFEIANSTKGHYLKINDHDNVFPYLTKDTEGYSCVPLKVTQEGDIVHIGFRDQMFVNTKTLSMSSKRKTSYATTRLFYIHPNSVKSILPGDAFLYLDNIGRNHINIKIPINIHNSWNLVGLCHDSTYCFSGGIKE